MQNHPFPDPQDSPHAPMGSGPSGAPSPSGRRSRARTWGAAVGLLAAGAVGGAALAGTLSANAATPSPTSSTATGEGGSGAFPAHGSAPHESAETPVTGANATKAQAAAVKAVGGGTAGAVTADFTKSGYEVTVTKTDGTPSEVHLDSTFAVMTHGGGHDGPDGGNDTNDQPAG